VASSEFGARMMRTSSFACSFGLESRRYIRVCPLQANKARIPRLGSEAKLIRALTGERSYALSEARKYFLLGA